MRSSSSFCFPFTAHVPPPLLPLPLSTHSTSYFVVMATSFSHIFQIFNLLGHLRLRLWVSGKSLKFFNFYLTTFLYRGKKKFFNAPEPKRAGNVFFLFAYNLFSRACNTRVLLMVLFLFQLLQATLDMGYFSKQGRWLYGFYRYRHKKQHATHYN